MGFDKIFGYVTGAVSVASFVLLLIPYFEKYKTQLSYIFVFFAGLCAGAVASTFSPSSVSVSFEGSLFQGFLVVAAIASASVAFLIIVTTAIANDVSPVRTGSGSAAVGLFLICTLMFGLSSCEVPNSRDRLETGELLTLSSYYEGIGNVEAAVGYLERAIARETAMRNGSSDLGNVLVQKMSDLLARRATGTKTPGDNEKLP